LEEDHVPTSEEVADRTLNRLRHLGKQRFALSPFDEYFGNWLMDLRDVLSEFESSPTIKVDDQFTKERSQILSNVELELEETVREQVSREEATKSLSNNRILLEQIEEEYTTNTRKIERQKNSEIKRLSSNIDSLRGELDRIARIRTGIFRAVSKKAKAQKEEEATQRLNSALSEYALTEQKFTAKQERLRDEYERRKQPIIEHIRDQEKEVEKQEIDWSLEPRRTACEALVNAVNALLQRSIRSGN
jgi:chromosome segregation ATPase